MSDFMLAVDGALRAMNPILESEVVATGVRRPAEVMKVRLTHSIEATSWFQRSNLRIVRRSVRGPEDFFQRIDQGRKPLIIKRAKYLSALSVAAFIAVEGLIDCRRVLVVSAGSVIDKPSLEEVKFASTSLNRTSQVLAKLLVKGALDDAVKGAAFQATLIAGPFMLDAYRE